MSEIKLPVQESLLVAINNLIEARIELHTEKTSEPRSMLNIDGANRRIKSAEYRLLAALDDLQVKT